MSLIDNLRNELNYANLVIERQQETIAEKKEIIAEMNGDIVILKHTIQTLKDEIRKKDELIEFYQNAI